MAINDFLANTLKSAFNQNKMKSIYGNYAMEDQPTNPDIFHNVDFSPQPQQQSEYNIPQENIPTQDQQVQVQDQGPNSLDQFRQSVMAQPQRDSFGSKTNILRMLGTGALSGLQGTEQGARKPIYNRAGKVIGTAPKGFWEQFGEQPFNIGQTEAIMNTPYEKKVEDWKQRTAGLQKVAELQSKENPELDALHLAQARRLPQMENRLQTQGDTRLGQGQQRVDISQQHQQLDEWKAKNPQGKVYAPKGGNVVIINPQTGEATDTGIASGTLNDEQRIRLTGDIKSGQIQQQGNIRSGQITQQGDIRSGQIGQQHENKLGEIGASGDQARETKGTLGAGTTKPLGSESATQTKTRLQLRANEAIQEHPEWEGFIKINPNNGMVDIEPPGKTWYGAQSGPDKATHDEIVSYIRGQSKSSNKPIIPENKPATSTAKPPDAKLEAGYVKVVDISTGKVVAQIPKADAERLNKQKYQVVQ